MENQRAGQLLTALQARVQAEFQTESQARFAKAQHQPKSALALIILVFPRHFNKLGAV